MKKGEPIRVRFHLEIDGVSSNPIERTLELENIPGAWRIHGTETEIPGEGQNRSEAVMCFLGRNYSGRRLAPTDVAEAIVSTFLKKAEPPVLDEAVLQLVEMMVH